MRLAGKIQSYALNLLALNPSAYNAYRTLGMMEYVMGSVPFFGRWFTHYDRIQESEREGIRDLCMVAKYYGCYPRLRKSCSPSFTCGR